jgi:ribosomal protein S18 acetylase RimI-like enzyme/predicted GNAT family acetyltransferase
MELQFKPAWALPLAELADVFTRAFAGYIAGDVQMTPALLTGMIAQGGIDLNLSQVAYRHDAPVGFALIARQGWASRVAVMGIVPEAQGQRVGWQLLVTLVEQARARGERMMELEVFEQNTRAIRLYEALGFRPLRRLYGYSCEAIQGDRSVDLKQIDIFDVARQIASDGAADLPWTASGIHIARMGAPSLAYRLGEAVAVITDPSAETIAIRAFHVPSSTRRQGQGRRLISTVAGEFPDKRWVVPALCPEEYGGFFEAVGFVRQEINQFQMRLDLTALPK